MSDEPTVEPNGDDPTAPETRRVRRVVPKSAPDPEPRPASEPAAAKPGVSTGRKTFWLVGLAVGGYMIVRGVYGILTGDPGTP